ncbi:MAG: Xaa-Pro aminopeptidase [Myxococcota bacterium]|jgi:Xaa-Pro aminopeptidase
MDDRDIAIFSGARDQIRNHDVEHELRQQSDFWYLTGFDEPDAILALAPGADKPVTMFVRSRDPKMETWTGRRLGVERAPETLQIDRAIPAEDFERELPTLLEGRDRLWFALGDDPDLDVTVVKALRGGRRKRVLGTPMPHTVLDSGPLVHERRLIKSPAEADRMRRAAAISAQAHIEAMAFCQPGITEAQLRGAFEWSWRRQGATRHAYPPIVAAGDNATVLHYTQLGSEIGANDLVLIDAGCEWEMYAADITRTFPASGRFTGPQRDVYEIVLDAQRQAIAAVKPGNTFQDAHDAALPVLTQGMIDIGLIEGPLDEAIEKKRYEPYYMHRTGHWLGLDVHDAGIYKTGDAWRALEPGMATTVEPGIYVPAADDSAPEHLRGIGIRIEDDILVTRDGNENLSAAAPRSIEDVEAACRG